MNTPTLTAHLASEADTERLALCLAPLLRAGDTILLQGPIGAGKTHFCRALIHARLGADIEVPSPTFTLVQTYDGDPDIWHADLYRLTHPDEARELGLEEAFDTAICLVEWPDRLGRHAPPGAITIRLGPDGDGRTVEVAPGTRPEIAVAIAHAFHRTDRAAAARRFLSQTGWLDAQQQPLAGDASTRVYTRLWRNGQSRMLIDAEPGTPDVDDFFKIDRHLLQIGLSAPVIFDHDLQNGFLQTEDFGDGVFACLMEADPQQETPLYRAAVDVLAHLSQSPAAPGIADLSNHDWAEAVGLVLDWYRFAITGERVETGTLTTLLTDLLDHLANGPKVMILRDYHAENLMWLPDREGLRKVGLLDFQLAQMGQAGYDLVSLLQDARREVPPSVEAAMIRHYLTVTGTSEAEFLPKYAMLGAQRALRILGIFARLSLMQGKPSYVALIPRVWDQLQCNLARPELAALARLCDQVLPRPTMENLDRIRVQCGNFR